MDFITLQYDRAYAMIPPRDAQAHKGVFGRDLIWGGSVGLTGAPVLAAGGTLHMGAGLVHVAVQPEIYSIVAAKLSCAMPFPISSSDELINKAAQCDAVLIGCGLGCGQDAMIRQIASVVTAPLILDADGINAFSGHIHELPPGAILTPHEGEFLRLGGDLSLGRLPAALDMARKTGCIVVLKGHETVTAAPDGQYFINPTGNPGMAKGGSGDVLAGMILALLGQGVRAVEAAACAVYFHGRAGDLCAQRYGLHSFLPTHLIAEIGAAIGKG